MSVLAEIPTWTELRTKPDPKAVKLASSDRPEQPIKAKATKPLNKWLANLSLSVLALLDLKPGWDGPKAQPVNWKMLSKLVRILLDVDATVAPAPDLVPLKAGGIQAEWHYGDFAIEVGVLEDGRVYAYATDEHGDDLLDVEGVWFLTARQQKLLRRSLRRFAQRTRDHGEPEPYPNRRTITI